MSNDFDGDLVRLTQIQQAAERNSDCDFLLGFIDKLWREYMTALDRASEPPNDRLQSAEAIMHAWLKHYGSTDGCSIATRAWLEGTASTKKESLPVGVSDDTGPVAGREKPYGEPANAADAKADRLSVSNNRRDQANHHFRKCLQGHVAYSASFGECPSCKIDRGRRADETSPVPSIREFIEETRKSCLHGGDKHCPYFKKGHPCCDCGASASEKASQ